MRPAQQRLQSTPSRRPCRQAAPAASSVVPRDPAPRGSTRGASFPGGELETHRQQNDGADGERNGARQYRMRCISIAASVTPSR